VGGYRPLVEPPKSSGGMVKMNVMQFLARVVTSDCFNGDLSVHLSVTLVIHAYIVQD